MRWIRRRKGEGENNHDASTSTIRIVSVVSWFKTSPDRPSKLGSYESISNVIGRGRPWSARINRLY